MKAMKWIKEEHRYKEVKIPDGHYPAITDNMDEPCTCPHCGKDFKFGEMIGSHELYRVGGVFAYCVCPTCYEQEEY